jgi:branched-chain amino acid transport system ATP-binding protein
MLDELSLGLSPKLVTHAFQTIKTINTKFGTTILIVEQKVLEILQITHRIYALRMGEVVFEGSSAKVHRGGRRAGQFAVISRKRNLQLKN